MQSGHLDENQDNHDRQETNALDFDGRALLSIAQTTFIPE